MTDMRATERLLEVIGQLLDVIEPTLMDAKAIEAHDELLEILPELRRRGDTLVRAEDLRIVIAGWTIDRMTEHDPLTRDDALWEAAYQRLENALGGKMR